MPVGPHPSFWNGKRVLVTGHTGFKGGWLTAWLLELGAEVTGFALPPETGPSFFEATGLAERVPGTLGDIRDPAAIARVLAEFQPEIVFHLAAQPIVRRSYQEPVETFATNVMGTVHLLESVRHTPSVRAVVNVTTDKCYENREWVWGYRESDPMGGHDPYSASKGCSELVTAAYRRSFLAETGVGVATARAGNVFGGGDWAKDRIIPDAVRAFAAGVPLVVRNPGSVRPWQHVLEPLCGYLVVAERLMSGDREAADAWNFGPLPGSDVPVGELAGLLADFWGEGVRWERHNIRTGEGVPHEAHILRLDTSKALSRLGWSPRLELPEALEMTVTWYKRSVSEPEAGAMAELTRTQIWDYMQRAAEEEPRAASASRRISAFFDALGKRVETGAILQR
jgi:CDP-glucose 4,6-dehydratase